MIKIIDILSTLGTRLSRFGTDERTNGVIEQAIADNSWFTREDILRAVDAICREMLQREKIEEWLPRYTPTTEPKRVAVIMAGNIPLVGFFDLMCVLASGHTCAVKPSSKDKVLMHFVISELRDIDADIKIEEYSAEEHYDMAIATGGDDANSYFREHFATTRTLLRGSRHSVAVLDGRESREELSDLCTDITAYSGLGCRSVSMIFVPLHFRIDVPKCIASNPKQQRNIASQRALLKMRGVEFVDAGGFLIVGGDNFSESTALVTRREYSDFSEVQMWLDEHREAIQCVVSHSPIEHSVPFGRAQYPTLADYADGVDTMRFLLD